VSIIFTGTTINEIVNIIDPTSANWQLFVKFEDTRRNITDTPQNVTSLTDTVEVDDSVSVTLGG